MPDDDQQDQTEAQVAPDLNTHDVNLRVSQWLDAAFERYGQGERFTFLITVQALPQPDGNMSFNPAVIMWLPGAMLGQVMAASFLITNPCNVTRDEIDNAIQHACNDLLNARSQDLNKAANGNSGEHPPLRLT